MLAPGAARPAELQEILNDIVEDVNEAIQNALKLVHSDLGNQNVALYTEFAPHLPTVNGDGVQLQQVLLNVVVNGCDAMADVEAVGRESSSPFLRRRGTGWGLASRSTAHYLRPRGPAVAHRQRRAWCDLSVHAAHRLD